MQKNESSAKSATDVVMEWQQGVERRDYQSVRGLLSDNVSYVSPLNSFDGAEPYLKYLEHVNLPKFDIKKESRIATMSFSTSIRLAHRQ